MGVMTTTRDDFIIEDKPGIVIETTEQLLEQVETIAMLDAEQAALAEHAMFEGSLAGHIINTFETNKQARRDSGIEDEMLDAMRAFNSTYSEADKASMAEGGSLIYMPITSTKCRACSSWIKDILMPAKGKPWKLRPSKVEQVDPEVLKRIEEILNKEFTTYEQEIQTAEQEEQAQLSQGAAPQGPQGPQEMGQPASPPPGAAGPGAVTPQQPKPPTAGKAAQKLREMNKIKRDIKETLEQEIQSLAMSEMKQMEEMIEDQLHSGNWEKALSDFIEDFCVYPAAFMKGPIIGVKKKLRWENGAVIAADEYCYMNKRISPLDVYPSPSAVNIEDGALIEHMRLSRKDISALKGMPGYNDARIDEVLSGYSSPDFVTWYNTSIEHEKATEEMRGNSFDANQNIIHALHFHGPAQVSLLREWEYPEEELYGYDDNDEIEIEAILVDSIVIKAIIADDPLGRRPYYKASFQNRPGSYWGRSLPDLMDPIQRMCNATARALANNMGLASGPQVEVYTDRLADDGDIEDIYPMKIWQLQSDPGGAGGRAITFTQPSSNAAELLSVYKEFELRADDATGIPRYAYGNERTGGAAQTASGLSMLLESASKGIKDAIRHIDFGLIIPRIEFQFYWNLLQYGEQLGYTGDIQVDAIGSGAHTLKAAEQGKRMEFLQAIAGNPAIMEVVGPEGMTEIFRTMLEDVNLIEVPIPSRLELRMDKKAKEEAQAQQQQEAMKMMEQKNNVGLEATKIQTQGQQQMHAESIKLKQQEVQIKAEESQRRSIDKGRELESRERTSAGRNTVESARARADQEMKDLQQRRQLAFDLQNAMAKSPTDASTEGRRNA